MRIKHIAVLSCISDEAQVSQHERSVADQIGIRVTHVKFEGANFVEALKALHRYAFRYNHNYDFFAKLDADMVLSRADVLKTICQQIDRRRERQRMTVPVYDFFTDKEIGGFHCWRGSIALQSFGEERYRGDRWIGEMPGLTIQRHPIPLVWHSFSPSLEQAFRYGFNRGAKAMSGSAWHVHWISLLRLARVFSAGHSKRHERGAALLGGACACGLLSPVEGVRSCGNDSQWVAGHLRSWLRFQHANGYPAIDDPAWMAVRDWHTRIYQSDGYWKKLLSSYLLEEVKYKFRKKSNIFES